MNRGDSILTIPLSHDAQGAQLLDTTYLCFQQYDVSTAMHQLFVNLRRLRTQISIEEWRSFCIECNSHPLAELLREDPITNHCFQKPRGYAGDATLLDYVYGIISPPSTTSERGSEIYRYTYNTSGCVSVRERRAMMGHAIDFVASIVADPQMLSVACGHLREAELSAALRSRRVGRLVALDQDVNSLATVEQAYGKLGVQPVHGTVKDLITRRIRYSGMHLVYATGLYDYLPQPVASLLTRRLFEQLGPGGTLIIPNLAPNMHELGYMESFMGWEMIYRSESDMELLAARVPKDQIDEQRIYRDSIGHVVFMEVVKR